MSDPEGAGDFKQWAIVELMGHVRLAGMVTEEERFGAKMGRVDIPGPGDTIFATQYFSGASIYRVTPTTEEVARKIAMQYQPQPAALLTQAPGVFDEDDQDFFSF